MRMFGLWLALWVAMAASPLEVRAQTDWWADAVFYEIFVRSFQDSDGDGIGDFNGVTSRVDHLVELGVNAVWFMPIHPSPSYHGYDVVDYFSVNPEYGTQADFEAMLAALENAGIRVIIDFVGNHSSSQHPRFLNSALGPSAQYRDHFTWSDIDYGAGWHPLNGSHYLGSFWSGMPDWNVTHPDVVQYHYDVLDHWVGLGVDGFRYDAVKHLVDDFAPGFTSNHPGTFDYLADFYSQYKSISPEVFCVGEVWDQTSVIAQYGPPYLDGCFEFGLASGIVNSVNGGSKDAFVEAMNTVLDLHLPGQYAPFLTNHDQDRAFNQLGLSADKMKLAASVYLSMPGFPFVYYGEEIGMTGTGADPNKRTPMQWAPGPGAGFTTGTPWSPINGDQSTANVAVQDGDAQSLLNHYREVIHLRRNHGALRRGGFSWATAYAANVGAYLRSHEDTTILCLHNFSTDAFTAFDVDLAALCPGDYQVTDLVDGSILGQVPWGQITSWTVPGGVGPRGSRWLQLTPIQVDPCATLTTLHVDGATMDNNGAQLHVAGNFNGWTPEPMSVSAAGQGTFTVEAEPGTPLWFVYVDGDNIDNREALTGVCAADVGVGFSCRQWTTTTTPTDLPAVCFGSCSGCAYGPQEVTFSVDLGALAPHPEGVHMAGTFQGWDPAGPPMTWAYDNVWQHTLTLNVGQSIEYKFINGNSWGGNEEVNLIGCGVGGTLNRTFTLSGPSETPGIACFDSCTSCDPALCPEDLTGDGMVAVDDVLLLLGGFGCVDACPYDLDGDSLVGVSDMLAMLSEFGQACAD